ncbi:CD4-1 molecule [Carassius auratus]|uniref:CD4-1 molecule n=1 Tax=Carassius auratus TaxID=7957 RepID=A0A6P6R5K2_CARAU|nr:T-cell surface glycoprotein CD4-like [Carassius auratus]
MMLCWILISLFVGFLSAQERPIVIYAQTGGTVTLQRVKIEGNENNIYVNWYRGSESTPTITKNPQSGIQKAKEMKTHAELLSDFSLQISPVQYSDYEIWRCVQHIFAQTSEKTYKLYNVTIPKVPAVVVGESLTLQCQIASSPLKPKVTWIPPQNSGCDLRKHYTEKVTIGEVSKCHSGVWTCKLEYDKRETEAKTTVFIIELSNSAETIYTSSPSSASTVAIPCSLSSDIPWSILKESGLMNGSWSFTPLSGAKSTQSLLNLTMEPVVSWSIPQGANNTVKAEGRQLKDKDLSILNLPVSENVRGVYTCNLKIKTRTLSSKVKLEVLKLSSSGGPQIFEGQTVNLTCTLGHQHSPYLEVKWSCSSCSFVSSLKSPHPTSLSIPEVKLKDGGKWTCELLQNGKKLTSAVLSLRIVKAPVDIWLCVAISGGVVGFILLLVVIIICIRRHRQMMMYRRRKTKFCCCNNPQQNQKGFYKT